MNKYDYHISISDVLPPVGKSLRYVAKVDYLYRVDSGMEVKISVDFGEALGVTFRIICRVFRIICRATIIRPLQPQSLSEVTRSQ